MRHLRTFLTLFVLNMSIFTVIFLRWPENRLLFTAEDKLVENLSAFFFLSAFVVSLPFFYWLKQNKMRWLVLLIGMVGLVGFGDELSFGERYFDLSMPVIADDMKMDGLHDVVEIIWEKVIINYDIYSEMTLLFLAGGLGLLFVMTRYRTPLVSFAYSAKRYQPFIIMLLFALLLLGALILDLGFFDFVLKTFFEELFEMNAALALVFVNWSIYQVEMAKE